MAQADDVTEDWGGHNSVISDEEASDEEHSQDDSDDSTDASEDAISVLAQAAVEEVMEEAVRQAEPPGSNANAASLEASPPRPCSALGEEDSSPQSADCEEEGRWGTGESSSPPTSPNPASSGSTSQLEASTPGEDQNDEEVTCEAEPRLT